MAKENYIFLIGQVCKAPKIKCDEDGNPVRASFGLTTLRRDKYDKAGNFAPRWDRPIILTGVPQYMKQIEEIKEFDFVEVKGTVTTKDFVKRTVCPHCGAEQLTSAMMTFINPVYIGIRGHAESRTDGLPYLAEVAEASNILKLIGRVCKEPVLYTYDDGTKCCNYPIAVNRKLYVEGSQDEEDHADYPWVKSFGEQAEENINALDVDSLVYIDGYIRTVKRVQEFQCTNPECGQIYTSPNTVMEVIPYSTEYLENCNLPDATHVSKADAARAAAVDAANNADQDEQEN